MEKHISDHQIGHLDRQDGESYRIIREALNVVRASLLAGESIGPLEGGDHE